MRNSVLNGDWSNSVPGRQIPKWGHVVKRSLIGSLRWAIGRWWIFLIFTAATKLAEGNKNTSNVMPTKFLNVLETSKLWICGHYCRIRHLDSVSYVLLHFLTLRFQYGISFLGLIKHKPLTYFCGERPIRLSVTAWRIFEFIHFARNFNAVSNKSLRMQFKSNFLCTLWIWINTYSW